MDEEERRDRKEDNRTVNQLKRDVDNTVKKKAKSKFTMSIISTIVAALTSKFGIILIAVISVLTVLGVASRQIDIKGSTDVTDVATETVITENTEIKPAPNPEDGYYFQISDDVVEKFLEELNRAYHEGHYFDHIEQNKEGKGYEDENNIINDITSGMDDGNIVNQSDFVYDPVTARIKEETVQEWFNAKDYKDYLVKFIRAEIASMYPKLGDYAGGNILGKDNPRDSEGKYAAQGVVQIQRTLMNQDRNYRKANNTYI